MIIIKAQKLEIHSFAQLSSSGIKDDDDDDDYDNNNNNNNRLNDIVCVCVCVCAISAGDKVQT